MDGLTIEMLSTNTEEHLCMCEHLKWNGTRESKEKIMWWEKRTHMPILFHRNGMTKTHSISTFMAQLTVLNGANETFERHHSDAYNEHTTWTMESECLWCVCVWMRDVSTNIPYISYFKMQFNKITSTLKCDNASISSVAVKYTLKLASFLMMANTTYIHLITFVDELVRWLFDVRCSWANSSQYKYLRTNITSMYWNSILHYHSPDSVT